MKAMILTAGLGTRLRPLTLRRAKPAIPVCGKPLVLRTIENLHSQGVCEFRLNLSWLPETIKSIFESACGSGFNVSFSYEPEILGTAGGLKSNQAFFNSGTFLMVNGDTLFDFNIAEALNFHKQNGAIATLVLYPQKPPFEFTPVRIDDAFNIISFSGNSIVSTPIPQEFLFTGIHIMEPEIFEFIDSGVFYEIISQSYRNALERGHRIIGCPLNGYWNDLGSPARYILAVKDLLAGCIGGRASRAWVSDKATIHHCASLEGVTVERGATIESNCQLRDSIIWEDSIIRKNSVIRNCIIVDRVIFDGEHVDEVITVYGSRPLKLEQ